VSNFLGKLKDIIGGNQDYQYYEEEIEEMATKDLTSSPEELMSLSEEEGEPQTLSSSASSSYEKENSSFQTSLSSERLMEESDLSRDLPNNVIGMPGINTAMNEVVVIEAHSFDEIPQVIQTLREQRCVVLNLNVMDPDEAQRAVDFVAGGTYAIDGHQERIGESIFLFTPRSVKVNSISGNSAQVKKNSLSSHTFNTSFSESLWDDQPTNIPRQIAQ
jgi:cell division inhibitor SepF